MLLLNRASGSYRAEGRPGSGLRHPEGRRRALGDAVQHCGRAGAADREPPGRLGGDPTADGLSVRDGAV